MADPDQSPAAAGIRIGGAAQNTREARASIAWHIDKPMWLTNVRHADLRPQLPVIASACGTVLFLRGVVVDGEPDVHGGPGDDRWSASWRFAYPVKFEPVIYRGDMANRVLAHLSTYVRSFKVLDEREYQQALTGLREA